MCRWLAYSGSPVPLDDVLYRPDHSLIDQSMHARMGVETFNADGFGVGWYDQRSTPARYRSVAPAWGDRNLREIAGHVTSPLFLAHIRASTGTAVQQTNCHPFRHGRWLWVHNGLIREFHTVKRDLMLAVDPALFADIEGETDSELMLYLAVTFGLEDDPPSAVERMVGFVEDVGRRHGVEHPIQMTVGTTDGEAIWVFRYSSEHDSRSLFFTFCGQGTASACVSCCSQNFVRLPSASPERSGGRIHPGTRAAGSSSVVVVPTTLRKSPRPQS